MTRNGWRMPSSSGETGLNLGQEPKPSIPDPDKEQTTGAKHVARPPVESTPDVRKEILVATPNVQTPDVADVAPTTPPPTGTVPVLATREPRGTWSTFVYNLQKWCGNKNPKLTAADIKYYDQLDAEAAAEAERAAQAARDAETARKEQQALVEEYDELGKRINWLVKIAKVHLVLAVINQFGGASKTWFANLLACVFADTTNMNPLVIEGRRNAAVGMKTLGVDRDATVSSRELHAKKDSIHNGMDLISLLSANDFGVLGLKTDLETPIGDTFTGEQAGEVVELTYSHLPLVVIDLGNNPTDKINIGMCAKAGVGAFVTIPSEESIEMCVATARTHQLHGLGHLSKFGFYMVNMMRPGMQAEDFREQLEVPEGTPILGTYYDQVTDTTWSAHSASHKVNKVIRLDNLQLITLVSLRRALVTALELQQQADAAKKQQGEIPPQGPPPDDTVVG